MIYILGCGAAKLEDAAPALQLYTGPLFQAAAKYAFTHYEPGDGDLVRILSAKHGLIAPSAEIEPYDTRWGDSGAINAYQLRKQLEATWKRQRFVMLCGVAYATTLLDAYRECFGEHALFDAPLLGMGIGQQTKWLRENARSLWGEKS